MGGTRRLHLRLVGIMGKRFDVGRPCRLCVLLASTPFIHDVLVFPSPFILSMYFILPFLDVSGSLALPHFNVLFLPSRLHSLSLFFSLPVVLNPPGLIPRSLAPRDTSCFILLCFNCYM